MWSRLSGVANNVAGGVAGLVGPVADEALQLQLQETREQLNATQEELKSAMETIKARDLELQNMSLSKHESSVLHNKTSEDIEAIRHRLEQFKLSGDDEDAIEDVISEISFSLSEKASTISELQDIIEDLKARMDHTDGEVSTSPTSEEFHRLQVSRLTDLCTALRKKEKAMLQEQEELKLELADAKSEINNLKFSEKEVEENEDLLAKVERLTEENKMLLCKVASEAAHKDILRDELEDLREGSRDKLDLLENIKELQAEIQKRNLALEAEKKNVSDLSTTCEELRQELTSILSAKQTKLHKNLFEVVEEESKDEEMERIKTENTMLINKISDLMQLRDEYREEIEKLKEVRNTSDDVLRARLTEKEMELEDILMINSLLQEQIKGKGVDNETVQQLNFLVESLKERNENSQQLTFLQTELKDVRAALEEKTTAESLLKFKLAEVSTQLETYKETSGSRILNSVNEDDEINSSEEHPELQTTAELLAESSSLQSDPTQLDTLKSEINRLKDCLNAREELISGLREDISMRQEKESNYREKVAELYSQIESKEAEQVKDVIDFSDSFVSGLEEQLNIAQRIIKVKEDEIAGLNKALLDISSQPLAPSSPLPRTSNVDDELDECKIKIVNLTNLTKNLNEEMLSLQSALDDKDCQINILNKQMEEKTTDIEKIQKEYEAEMMNMSSTYRDQKAVNTEELGYLTEKIKELENDKIDLEFENRNLLERFERTNEDFEALKVQLENEDLGLEGMESTALQAKYNLKDQQLQNALVEIENLNKREVNKSVELADLEHMLSNQRQINVQLQERIDDLLDRCEILENKESDYLQKIQELEKELTDLSVHSGEEIKNLTVALKASKEGFNDVSKKNELFLNNEAELKQSVKDLQSSLKELQISKERLKSDVQASLNEVSDYWNQCFETLKLELATSTQQLQAHKGGDALEHAMSHIEKLRSQHSSLKSEVLSILQSDFSGVFLEFKNSMFAMLGDVSAKDEELVKLRDENKKLKTKGKKLIEKLKRGLKDKESLLKKLSTEAGDERLTAFHDENVALNKRISELEQNNDSLQDTLSGLKSVSEEKNAEIEELKTSLQSLNELNSVLESANKRIDGNISLNSFNVVQGKLDQALENYEALQDHCTYLKANFDLKNEGFEKLEAELQSALEDNKCKDEIISGLKMNKDDLQRLVDTLTSQVSEIADEKDKLQCSFDEKLENLLSEKCLENNELKNLVESQSAEVKKYLAMVKKLKLIKDDLQNELREKEQIISDFDKYGKPQMVECDDVGLADKNDVLLITEAMQNSSFSPISDDLPNIEQVTCLDVNTAPPPDSSDKLGDASNPSKECESTCVDSKLITLDESIRDHLIDFMSQLQSIYKLDLMIDHNYQLDSLENASTSIIDHAQHFMTDYETSKNLLASLEDRCTWLEENIQAKEDALDHLSAEKDKEVRDLNHQLQQFILEKESSQIHTIDIESFNIVQERLDEALEKSETLEWELNNLKENLESKRREFEGLEMKFHSALEDNKCKDDIISELKMNKDDLQQFVDTLTSQVSVIADEKDKLQCSFDEKLEYSLSEKCLENNELKNVVESQAAEVKKYLGMVKKLKLIKDNLQKDLAEKDDLIRRLKEHGTPDVLKCEDITPVVDSMQIGTFSGTDGAPPDVQEESRPDLLTAPSPSDAAQVSPTEDVSVREELRSLVSADEVAHLQSIISTLESSLAHNEKLVQSLEEQLSESKKVLLETRQECQTKLQDVIEQNEKYSSEIATLKSDNQALIEELKVIKANIGEGEALVKKDVLANNVADSKNHESDRVSEASVRSKSTSYQSKSSYGNRELPNDIETLKAELMKKNKLAFFIRNRAKKAESRIKEVKRDAEKTSAHRSIKDKLELIEKDLVNVGEHLKNLSHGKKIDRQATNTHGAQQIEEMEKKIQRLTKIEEQYEQIMSELQTQIKSKNFADQKVKDHVEIIEKLNEEIVFLHKELDHKDNFLNDRVEEERMNYSRLAEDFDHQRAELLHIREINVNMKNTLIRVNEDAGKIEDTYKSTMHELEAEIDQLKIDKVELCDEVKKCWAQIDELDAQNREYMLLLEQNAEKVQNLESHGNVNSSDIQKLNEANADYHQKLLVSEREKTEVIKQLVELKELYDSCLISKNDVEIDNANLKEMLNKLEQQQAAISNTESLVSNDADRNPTYESLHESNVSLSAQVVELTAAIEQWQAYSQQQQAYVESLQEEKLARDSQLQSLTESSADGVNLANNRENDSSTEQSHNNEDIDTILKENDELKSLVSSLEQNIVSLEESLQKAKDIAVEHTVALENWHAFGEEQENYKKFTEQEMSQKNSELDSLREELTVIKAQLNELQSTNANIDNEACATTEPDELVRSSDELQQEKQKIQESYNTMQAELTAIVTELDDSKAQIAEYTAALEQWRAYDQEQQAYRDSLLQQKSELDDEIRKLREAQHDFDSVREELTGCKERLEEALSELESSELNATQISAEMISLDDKYKKLIEDNASLQMSYNDLQDENLAVQQSLKEVKLQNDKYEESLEQWQQYDEDQKKQSNILADQISAKEEELNNMIEAHKTSQEELKILQDSLEQKEALLSEMKAEIEQHTAASTDVQVIQDEINNERERNSQLQREYDELCKSQSALQEDIVKVNKELEEANAKISEYTTMLEQWQVYEQQQQGYIASLLDHVSKEEHEKIVQEKVEMEEKINNLSSTVENLNNVNKELVDSRGNTERELNEQIIAKENEVIGIKEKLVIKERDCEDLQDSLNQTEDLLKEKMQQLEKLSSAETEADNSKQKLVAIQKEYSELQQAQSTVQENLVKVNNELEEANAKIGEYTTMLEQWQVYEQQQQGYIASLQEQISETAETKEKHDKVIEENEVVKQQLENKITNLSTMIESLELRNKELTSQISSIESTQSSMEEELRQQLSHQEVETGNLRNLLKDNELNLKNLEAVLEEKDEFVNNLNNRNEEMATKIASLETVQSCTEKELREQISANEMEADSLKRTLQNDQQKIKELECNIEEKDELLKQKLEQLTSAETEADAAREELASVKEQKSLLQKEYSELQTVKEDLVKVNDELEEANNKISEYTTMLEQWHVYEQQQQGYIASLQQQMSETNDEHNTIVKEKITAEEEIMNLSRTVENLENLHKELASAQASAEKDSNVQINILKEEQNKMIEENTAVRVEMETKITELSSENENLVNLKNELESKIENTRSSMAVEFSKQLLVKETEANDLRELLNQNKQRLEELEGCLQEKEELLRTKTLHLEQQARDLAEGNIAKEELSNALERNGLLQKEYSELQQSEMLVKEDLVTVNRELGEVKERISVYTEKLDQWQVHEHQQQTYIASLLKKLSEITEMKDENDKVNNENALIINQAENKIADLLSTIEDCKSQNNELKSTILSLEEAKAVIEKDLSGQVSQKEKELEDLNAIRGVNEETIKNLQDTLKAKDDLLQQKLTTATQQATAEAIAAKEKLITVREESDILQKEYSELQKSQVTAREDLGKVIKDLDNANVEIDEYKTKLMQSQARENEQKAYVESLRQQVSLCKKEIDLAKEKSNKMVEERASHKKQIEDRVANLLSTINQHENMNNELSSKLQAAESARAHSEKQIVELKSLKESEISGLKVVLKNNEQKMKELQENFDKNVTLLHEKTMEVDELTETGLKANMTVDELKKVQERNHQLMKENDELKTLEKEVSGNCKSLRDGISVFQERDRILNETMEKLKNHSETVTAHANELNAKIVKLESDNRSLKQQLSSKSLTAVDTNAEIDKLKLEKDKLFAEINNYKAQLQKSFSNLSVLEKSLSHMTAQYNEQLTTVAEKKQEFSKLAKHYNHLKEKYLSELNNRKKLVHDTITGRDKINQKIGEKSRQLKETQFHVNFYQKDRENLCSAMDGIQEVLKPFKEEMQSLNSSDSSSTISVEPRSLVQALARIGDRILDIQLYLSKPIEPPRIQATSEYSRADSIISGDTDFAVDRSLKSELSLFSELTNLSHIRGRSSSNTSTTSERLKATPEINRTSTNVLNRLAYNLIGTDSVAREPSANNSSS